MVDTHFLVLMLLSLVKATSVNEEWERELGGRMEVSDSIMFPYYTGAIEKALTTNFP